MKCARSSARSVRQQQLIFKSVVVRTTVDHSCPPKKKKKKKKGMITEDSVTSSERENAPEMGKSLTACGAMKMGKVELFVAASVDVVHRERTLSS